MNSYCFFIAVNMAPKDCDFDELLMKYTVQKCPKLTTPFSGIVDIRWWQSWWFNFGTFRDHLRAVSASSYIHVEWRSWTNLVDGARAQRQGKHGESINFVASKKWNCWGFTTQKNMETRFELEDRWCRSSSQNWLEIRVGTCWYLML